MHPCSCRHRRRRRRRRRPDHALRPPSVQTFEVFHGRGRHLLLVGALSGTRSPPPNLAACFNQVHIGAQRLHIRHPSERSRASAANRQADGNLALNLLLDFPRCRVDGAIDRNRRSSKVARPAGFGLFLTVTSCFYRVCRHQEWKPVDVTLGDLPLASI